MTTFGTIVAFGICYLAVGVAVVSVVLRLAGEGHGRDDGYVGFLALVWPMAAFFGVCYVLFLAFRSVGWLVRKVAAR